jgi:hypothetical protein
MRFPRRRDGRFRELSQLAAVPECLIVHCHADVPADVEKGGAALPALSR